MPTSRARRFDLIEVFLIAVFVALTGWKFGTARSLEWAEGHADIETKALADKYGPGRNSQYQEEWIVRDFFEDRHGGVFLDIGANHYKAYSNTYYLETSLGWSGIAVEPQRQFETGYTQFRPRTRFRPFFVSDESNQEAKLYVQSRNPLVTSADKAFNSRYGNDTKELEVPTITIDDLLASEHVTELDFVTMDVELWEPKALAGFDLERFHPALVCVEAHPEVRQQILDYFAVRGYTVAGKYLRADTENLYFMPLGSTAAAHVKQSLAAPGRTATGR